jgi:hypothetical protein
VSERSLRQSSFLSTEGPCRRTIPPRTDRAAPRQPSDGPGLLSASSSTPPFPKRPAEASSRRGVAPEEGPRRGRAGTLLQRNRHMPRPKARPPTKSRKSSPRSHSASYLELTLDLHPRPQPRPKRSPPPPRPLTAHSNAAPTSPHFPLPVRTLFDQIEPLTPCAYTAPPKEVPRLPLSSTSAVNRAHSQERAVPCGTLMQLYKVA